MAIPQNASPSRLLKERRAEIRTVNRDVAKGARLEETCLVVEGRRAGSAAEARRRVALQAEQVHVAHFQHVRIGAAMDDMARLASVRFYRRMLVNKRPMLVGMTLETNLILRGGQTNLLCQFRAVGIVAVAALNQAFVDPMMKRHGELRLLLKVARIAHLRLGLRQQELLGFGVMRGVARNTTDVVLLMNGVEGVHVFGRRGMTGQATVVNLLGGVLGENENLRFIPAASDVGRPWTMAAFATLVRRPPLGIERRSPHGMFCRPPRPRTRNCSPVQSGSLLWMAQPGLRNGPRGRRADPWRLSERRGQKKDR